MDKIKRMICTYVHIRICVYVYICIRIYSCSRSLLHNDKIVGHDRISLCEMILEKQKADIQ
jgi:hypothetical protein